MTYVRTYYYLNSRLNRSESVSLASLARQSTIYNIWAVLLNITRKMVPITGRASSFLEYFFVCTLIERKRRMWRQNNNYRATNLPKVTLLFTDYKSTTNPNLYHTQSILCQHSIYIHTYICIINWSIHNAFY